MKMKSTGITAIGSLCDHVLVWSAPRFAFSEVLPPTDLDGDQLARGDGEAVIVSAADGGQETFLTMVCSSQLEFLTTSNWVHPLEDALGNACIGLTLPVEETRRYKRPLKTWLHFIHRLDASSAAHTAQHFVRSLLLKENYFNDRVRWLDMWLSSASSHSEHWFGLGEPNTYFETFWREESNQVLNCLQYLKRIKDKHKYNVSMKMMQQRRNCNCEPSLLFLKMSLSHTWPTVTLSPRHLALRSLAHWQLGCAPIAKTAVKPRWMEELIKCDTEWWNNAVIQWMLCLKQRSASPLFTKTAFMGHLFLNNAPHPRPRFHHNVPPQKTAPPGC